MRARLWVAGVVLVGLLVASGASAAKARTVGLKLTVTGLGTIRVTGSSPFTCKAGSCQHTFHVPLGKRITVKASPQSGWKLTAWAGACKGSSPTCSLRLKATRSVAVTFVPPGDRLNPYPLGSAVPVGSMDGDWEVTVNSATIDADTEVEAENGNVPPPAGDHYTLVNFTFALVGGGSSSVANFLQDGAFVTEGSHNAPYSPDACTPPSPDLGSAGTISSGQSATGNLCYVTATNDASTLVLSATSEMNHISQPLWFALK